MKLLGLDICQFHKNKLFDLAFMEDALRSYNERKGFITSRVRINKVKNQRPCVNHLSDKGNQSLADNRRVED